MSVFVGTDLSDASVEALRSAAWIAAGRRAELVVVHCVEWADPNAFWRSLVETPWEDPQNLRTRARQRLQTFIDEHLPESARPPNVALRVELADASETMTEIAGSDAADLLVLGATGHGRVATMLMGSTADYVVRSSDGPVLTVPEAHPLEAIDTVLAPVDLSEASRAGLRVADAWSCEYDASLHILRALPIPAAGMVPADLEIPTGDPDEHRRRGRQELESFVARTDLSCSQRELAVSTEPPFAAILQTADAVDADLTVMATHGRRGLERFFLGSTTSKVLRRLERPVLTIRPATASS